MMGAFCSYFLLQYAGVGNFLYQGLLEKGRANEVSGVRMCHAARIAARPGQDVVHGPRCLLHTQAIVDKHHFGQTPGACEALYWLSEVDYIAGFVFGIDEAEVRQIVGKGAEQKFLLFEGQKIGTVYPDQIHCAVTGATCCLFRHYASHGF